MKTYFLTCSCGTAEVVGKPSGRCEGCGAPYKDLAEIPATKAPWIGDKQAFRDPHWEPPNTVEWPYLEYEPKRPAGKE